MFYVCFFLQLLSLSGRIVSSRSSLSDYRSGFTIWIAGGSMELYPVFIRFFGIFLICKAPKHMQTMRTCHCEDSDYESNVAAGQHDVFTVRVLLCRLLFPRRPQADQKNEDVEHHNGSEPDQVDSHASLWVVGRSGESCNNEGCTMRGRRSY